MKKYMYVLMIFCSNGRILYWVKGTNKNHVTTIVLFVMEK